MGIESDQVVYEYLSRVGDVAQQRQLPSGARMRLVSELRNEIDRRRAGTTADTPAAVRRILDRIGSPDEVVAAAGDGTAGGPRPPSAQVPVQRDGDGPRPSKPRGLGLSRPKAPDASKPRGMGPSLPRSLRRMVPSPRAEEPAAPQEQAGTPARPYPAGQDFGDGGYPPDWWRVGRMPVGEEVEGFVGGIVIPELLGGPRRTEAAEPRRDGEGAAAGEKAPGAVEAVVEGEAEAPRRRFGLPVPAGNWGSPLLLASAALLVVGAVLGNWFALLLGWLIAYLSRQLTQSESKWAVLGMPGLALGAGMLWLWGRTTGRWGTPIAEGHMNDAVTEAWPWVVRGAAVLSALFVLWRAQRRV